MKSVFAVALSALAIFYGHVAQAQDIDTVNWSGAVRYDSTDQTNPYYLAPDPTITWTGIATSQADTVMNADTPHGPTSGLMARV